MNIFQDRPFFSCKTSLNKFKRAEILSVTFSDHKSMKLEIKLIQMYICTPMFTAALFTTAKIWKQPKCPSINEWMKYKWWYISTKQYYSTIRKNKILLCESMFAEKG